ncbi:MAG: hypothetical protein NC453_16135, partial [Muribaculum sp.]|nr:hypothetical protein [Muribaculum sp.]
SAPRSGRGGRKFESSHPDPFRVIGCNSTSYNLFLKITGTESGQVVSDPSIHHDIFLRENVKKNVSGKNFLA